MDSPQPSNDSPQIGSQDWSCSLPKIDLHRHLEGSLRVETLVKIAREYEIPLSFANPEALRAEVQISQTPRDFLSFLQIFEVLKHFYVSKKVLQLITQQIITDAADDNVRYLELRFNPQALAKTQNFDLNDVVEWVMQAAENAQDITGTRTCLILQIPRSESLKFAEEIVDIAIAHHGSFVRGIDLAGDEEHYPPDIFIHPLQRARSSGLNITVHAGEASGAQSIHDAITHLSAQRIGHGIHAIESASTLNLLQKLGITLEICPTSNIKTGLVSDFEHHPLAALHTHRLHITLNTDDPAIFITTSSQEIEVAVQKIGIPPHHIYRFLRYGVEAAFIPPDERPWLRGLFRDALHPYPGALNAFNAVGS